jgi:hypothetical protein
MEQYPQRHLQTPRIFFPASDSHISHSILSNQSNDSEVDMASPKRLYTCGITFLLYIPVDPLGLLWFKAVANLEETEGGLKVNSERIKCSFGPKFG